MAQQNYLVADIGATNARFALSDGQQLVGGAVVLATGEYKRSSDMLSQALAQLDAGPFERAVFALAGPVDAGGDVEIINTGLGFNRQRCAREVGCEVRFVNDFYALASAVPYFESLVQLGGGQQQDGAKAVLGPGTGLGMATLVPIPSASGDGSAYHVLASEGGHADLAPGNHLEAELWGALSQVHGHVSWETVLCGSGLVNLYTAMCATWGVAAQPLTAAEIVAQGVAIEDPVCHQTLETFCSLLGSAAGNLALTVGAVGGVYLGGGIVPRMLDFVLSSPLRRRFEERGDLSAYAAVIPLYVITETYPGLQGAVRCLNNSSPLP